MKLLELFTQEELSKQIEQGMVKVTNHPSGMLDIYNYTQIAQFNPDLWNHVTDLCRGLIVDVNGNIVARGFSKFWNFGDVRHPETLPENFPKNLPTITKKMDGSLGILYELGSDQYIATRGSFCSEQALWASDWLKKHNKKLRTDGYTPIFEIVYPANQIVVKYNFSGLVLLSVINNETGEELSYKDLLRYGNEHNLIVVEKFDKPIDVCVTEDIPNEEGYVASWDRKGTTPLRVKIKFSTYCDLHRMITQTSVKTVWEMMRDRKNTYEFLNNSTDDFKKWFIEEECRLKKQYYSLKNRVDDAFFNYEGSFDMLDPSVKKKYALYVTEQHGDISALLFAKMNYESILYKMIKPESHKQFKVEE